MVTFYADVTTSMDEPHVSAVGLPVAWIEEVVTDRAKTDFGDQRHHALVVALADHLADPSYQSGVEAGRDELGRAQPPIDHVVQDEVRVGVGESELVLVGLADPELCSRGLPHDLARYAEMRRELPQLRPVACAGRVDRAGPVPEVWAVPAG